MKLHIERWRDLVSDRPLLGLDLETTGSDAKIDGIVEIGLACFTSAEIERAIEASDLSLGRLIYPEPAWTHAQRCNPGMPIHPEAQGKHKISDEDVAALAGVESLAGPLSQLGDLRAVGFNCLRFDMPILRRLVPSYTPMDVLDVMGVWQAASKLAPIDWFSEQEEATLRSGLFLEPRMIGHQLCLAGETWPEVYKGSLPAAVFGLLGYPHRGAHGALPDALATVRVLFAAVALWPDLPSGAEALSRFAAEAVAFVVQQPDGTTVFARGKHGGCSVLDVLEVEPSYIAWVLCDPDTHVTDKDRIVAVIGQDKATELTVAQQSRGQSRGRVRGKRAS